MYAHHRETIERVTDKLKADPEVLAVIVGGSIAHGFATETSDVDILIVVPEEKYEKRFQDDRLHYFDEVSATYSGGYVDGKYICLDFMKKVARMGSEPARFAFKDAFLTYCEREEVREVLKRIPVYPAAEKLQRIRRFHAQFQTWRWFCDEAMKHDNAYLLHQAVNQLVLFGGRMILAHNESLYPFHKWFVRVLEEEPNKPPQFMSYMEALFEKKSEENIENFYRCIIDFTDWNVSDQTWPNLFMKYSEMNWLHQTTPVADI